MPWVARDDDGTVLLFAVKPRWNKFEQEWEAYERVCLYDRYFELVSGFPEVKRGECIKVKLEPVKD